MPDALHRQDGCCAIRTQAITIGDIPPMAATKVSIGATGFIADVASLSSSSRWWVFWRFFLRPPA